MTFTPRPVHVTITPEAKPSALEIIGSVACLIAAAVLAFAAGVYCAAIIQG